MATKKRLAALGLAGALTLAGLAGAVSTSAEAVTPVGPFCQAGRINDGSFMVVGELGKRYSVSASYARPILGVITTPYEISFDERDTTQYGVAFVSLSQRAKDIKVTVQSTAGKTIKCQVLP